MKINIYCSCVLVASLLVLGCKDQIATPVVESTDERILFTTLDFSNQDAQMHVISADSNGINQKDLGLGYIFDASPKKIFWITGDPRSEIISYRVSDKNGGNAITLNLNGPNESTQDINGFIISPDGSKILYNMNDTVTDSYNLYIMNSDGTGKRLVSNAYDYQTHTCFSPDSRQIAYYRKFDDGHNLKETIEIANTDGSSRFTLIPITNGLVDGYGSITWSKKNMIAYVDNDTIYTINSGGTGKQLLGDGYSPSWSPTGDTLACATWEGEVILFSSNGSVIANITNTPAIAEAWPRWSDDGKHLLITRWIGDFDNTLLTLEELTLPSMTTKIIASPGGFGYYVR